MQFRSLIEEWEEGTKWKRGYRLWFYCFSVEKGNRVDVKVKNYPHGLNDKIEYKNQFKLATECEDLIGKLFPRVLLIMQRDNNARDQNRFYQDHKAFISKFYFRTLT